MRISWVCSVCETRARGLRDQKREKLRETGKAVAGDGQKDGEADSRGERAVGHERLSKSALPAACMAVRLSKPSAGWEPLRLMTY